MDGELGALLEELAQVMRDASICGLGQLAPSAVLSELRLLEAGVGGGMPEALLTLEVDGQTVRVPEESTLLERSGAAGKDAPTLCYYPVLEPIGACRICVAEVEGSRVLVPACVRKAGAGMRVRTDTPRVVLRRRMVTELLQSSTDASLAPELQRYIAE